MDIFLQQMINGLVLGSMYALVALGYTMVYGIVNLINFAHGEVLMVGALTSWSVTVWLGPHNLPGWLLLLIALLCAVVVCSILNFTIEKVAYRPLRNAPRLAPLITAMGMSLLLQTLAMIIWKPNYKSYPTLLSRDPIFIGGAVTNFTQITILVVTAITLGGLMISTERMASEATTHVEPHNRANWMIDLVSSSMKPAPRKKKCHENATDVPHSTPRTATTDTTSTRASAHK